MKNTPQPVIVTRLNTAVYESLVKGLPKIYVNSTTTAHEAGFQLGVQHVLQKLREGFVVEDHAPIG